MSRGHYTGRDQVAKTYGLTSDWVFGTCSIFDVNARQPSTTGGRTSAGWVGPPPLSPKLRMLTRRIRRYQRSIHGDDD
jgi:hypothetical protein